VGGDLISFSTADPDAAAAEVRSRYGFEPAVRDGAVRFHVAAGDRFLPEFVRTFPQPLLSVSLQRPSLDDVFITLTGHEIRDSELDAKEQFLRGAAMWRGGR
jgi:ABC-2 type transport system ATP-binding protein